MTTLIFFSIYIMRTQARTERIPRSLLLIIYLFHVLKKTHLHFIWPFDSGQLPYFFEFIQYFFRGIRLHLPKYNQHKLK